MKISNIDRFNAKLALLPPLSKEEMRKAIAQSAEEIVDLQKRLAPVDDGDLQMSITWRWGNETKIAYSQSFGTVRGQHELSAVISAGNTRVRYAHLVEFGARPHTIRPKKAGGKLVFFRGGKKVTVDEVKHPGSRRQPFFYPGWRTGKKRGKSRISRAVRSAAKKVASS